jgi:hypothetical protein
MTKDKSSISQAASYKEISNFWDAHEVSEFWDKTKEASFEVKIESEYRKNSKDSNNGIK